MNGLLLWIGMTRGVAGEVRIVSGLVMLAVFYDANVVTIFVVLLSDPVVS